MSNNSETLPASAWAVCRLLWSPSSLAQAAARAPTSLCVFASALTWVVCVSLPMSFARAAMSEPYRDVSPYYLEALRGLPICFGITFLPVCALLLILPLFRWRLRLDHWMAHVRLTFLAPFCVLLPASVWCLCQSISLMADPSFGLAAYGYTGKPAWVTLPGIGIVGHPVWWPVMMALALINGVRGLYRLRWLLTHSEFPSCVTCGYNLTGNVSGRCPECGTPCRNSAAITADSAEKSA